MSKTTTANGQGDSALQIVNHPHAANRFAIVDLYGDFLKNEHGAVCGFKTREDAAKHLIPLEETEEEYQDGEIIPLSWGWTLRLSMNWDADKPYLQGFVYSPKGEDQDSASLAAARDLECTTGENEQEIPRKILRQIRDVEFDRFV